jgi:lipid-binding SYLF domain-containing protein
VKVLPFRIASTPLSRLCTTIMRLPPLVRRAHRRPYADMKSDALTYSRSKGLIAGVSLEGASIDTDNDANKKLYGKEIGARDCDR